MDATEGFEDFVTVVDAGSISAAARELDLPRSVDQEAGVAGDRSERRRQS